MTPKKPILEPGASPQTAEVTPPAASADEADADILVNHGEFEALQQDLDQALTKADEHWKLYLGAHAEMENLRKRTERDVQNAHKFALERFFSELLPARDSLEMGLAAANEGVDIAQLREGVELTLKQLSTAMEKFGAREVNPLGAKFNPAEHEAMAMVPTNQAEPNTVVQVIQKGYTLNERLIRPAKVLVAQLVGKAAG
jgi:molecular chaperone GrpE